MRFGRRPQGRRQRLSVLDGVATQSEERAVVLHDAVVVGPLPGATRPGSGNAYCALQNGGPVAAIVSLEAPLGFAPTSAQAGEADDTDRPRR